MEQHQTRYEGTQGGAVHPALTSNQQEGNGLPLSPAVQKTMKEVTYLKSKSKKKGKNNGQWILLSLIGPLETDRAKTMRLNNEMKRRDWMAWTPVGGTIHAGMWTQLIIAPPETGDEKRARLKAETVAENILKADKRFIFIASAIKETIDAKVKEHAMPIIARGINKDGFFVRLRNTNHVQ